MGKFALRRLLIIVLLVIFVVALMDTCNSAAADEPIIKKITDQGWVEATFEPLEGSIGGFTVQGVISSLKRQDPTFSEKLEQHDTWPCIAKVLQVLGEAEAGVPAEELKPGAPNAESYQLQMQHSGEYWSFWAGVAEFKVYIDSLEQSDLAGEGLQRVLLEIEQAFLPFLYPNEDTNR